MNNDDFLIMPGKVHIMRYMGLSEDGKKYWRMHCGTYFSNMTLEKTIYTLTLLEVKENNLDCCKKCFRNQFI